MLATYDIHRILQLLPHRYPMLLVDRVLQLEPNVRITALKNVSINEAFFAGHFPAHPIMPGVLIIEALAQAAALLNYFALFPCPEKESELYFIVGIDNARFRRPVSPGDQLHLHVKAERGRKNIRGFSAQALVDGELAAEANFLCAIKKPDQK
jgi:3-hydroxyacyl-[acyl-carrier-protein] dehydratase